MVCDKGQVIAPGKVSVLASSITYPYLPACNTRFGGPMFAQRVHVGQNPGPVSVVVDFHQHLHHGRPVVVPQTAFRACDGVRVCTYAGPTSTELKVRPHLTQKEPTYLS